MLRSIAEQRAATLHRDMLNTLHDPRFAQLMLQLHGWFHGRQWRQGGKLPKDSPLAARAHDAMAPLLRKAQRRLGKRIGTLDEHDAAGRHRVRIAARKARYAAEFFRDLLPGRRVKHYVHTLSGLQDRLGYLNDLAVADRLLGEVEAGAPSPEARYARGYLTGAGETESRHLRKALDAVERLKMTR
jgi:CHAD domain-containing protein